MERKIVSIVVVIAIVVSFFCCRNYMSVDNQIERFYNNATESIPNAVLYDLSEDEVIFEKGIDEKISIGSVMKILTACVGLKYYDLKDTIVVGEEFEYNLEGDSSRSMIEPGQVITFEQLLYAILIPSGSDAAYTLAVNTARKINNDPDMPIEKAVNCFAGEMNKYAEELGCKSTHLVYPDGQDHKKQHTCISDVIIIAKDALKYDILREIFSTYYAEVELASGEVYEWYNTNYMLCDESDYYFEGCLGIKTGHTQKAGYCLLSYAERDGKQLLSVVCNCATKVERFKIASRLFEVGFFAEKLEKGIRT